MTQGAEPGRRLASSASVLSLGNVASRALGLVREQVIAAAWGGSLEASAFAAAARVPTLLYDLLIGGMLSAALVPVMSGYAARDRSEFWRAAGALVGVAVAMCGAASLAVYAFAPALGRFLGRGYDPQGIALIESMLRVISPAILAFGVAGVLVGLLYALERFTLAAATGAVYNLGFIVAALALAGRMGAMALPLGVTIGALAQVMVLAPGLVGAAARHRPSLRHPAVGRIILLYIPVAGGLLISLLQGLIEPGFASEWGTSAMSWMRYATTLVQFPHGLIAVALSAAILPRLSAQYARGDEGAFAQTLSRGLRGVAVLILPAAVGLMVLADPLVGLVFQRGAFTAADRTAVAAALTLYGIGLAFAGLDWPLNYSFYARHDTRRPALVGALAVSGWFVAARWLPSAIGARWGASSGFLGLVLADSLKHAVHAAIMLVLVARATSRAGLAGLGRTTGGALAAAVAMGIAVAVIDMPLAARLGDNTVAWAVRVAVGLTTGIPLYAAVAHRLGVAEIGWALGLLRGRLAPSVPPDGTL